MIQTWKAHQDYKPSANPFDWFRSTSHAFSKFCLRWDRPFKDLIVSFWRQAKSKCMQKLMPSMVRIGGGLNLFQGKLADNSDTWRRSKFCLNFREVGTHLIEATSDGTKITGGPLIAKTYDSSLIQVTDLNGGIVGQPCQFKVDASMAGEGQLEISINEGEVPNHVQVVGGGRCLVSFTPVSCWNIFENSNRKIHHELDISGRIKEPLDWHKVQRRTRARSAFWN